MNPLTPRQIREAYHPTTRHESSLSRIPRRLTVKVVVAAVALALLAFSCWQVGREMYHHEINKPLPPAITEKQRAYVKDIEKRFSLVHHTWSVETPGRTVSLWYRGKWVIIN